MTSDQKPQQPGPPSRPDERYRARHEQFAQLAKTYDGLMTTDQVDQFRSTFIGSFLDEHISEAGTYPGWVLCEALDRIELGLPDGRAWEQYRDAIPTRTSLPKPTPGQTPYQNPRRILIRDGEEGRKRRGG